MAFTALELLDNKIERATVNPCDIRVGEWISFSGDQEKNKELGELAGKVFGVLFITKESLPRRIPRKLECDLIEFDSWRKQEQEWGYRGRDSVKPVLEARVDIVSLKQGKKFEWLTVARLYEESGTVLTKQIQFSVERRFKEDALWKELPSMALTHIVEYFWSQPSAIEEPKK